MPTLHSAQKWKLPQRDFKPGDVVLYYEANQVGNWPMGLVEEVYPGPSDNKVRKVLVRTANIGQANYKANYTERYVRQLVLLLPEDQLENE